MKKVGVKGILTIKDAAILTWILAMQKVGL
jgi:hypothetical protein